VIRYDALTGIRFIAAFGVFVAHFGHFDFGAQGVSLFFVLSGFILQKVYTERNSSFKQFYFARFARIYPAYIFSLIIALPVFWHIIQKHDQPIAFMASVILMLQAWDPSTAHYWNGPSWSLSAEALFYFIFPFILPVANVLKTRVMIAAIVILWGAQTIIQLTGDYSDGGQFISKFPLLRLPEFLIGIAFGHLHGITRPERLSWSLPVAVVLILWAFLFMPTAHTQTVLAPIYGLLLIGLTTHTGFLTSKVMVLLGEASYSFYLLHVPLMYWVLGAERFVFGPIPVFIKAPILLAMTIGLALFSLVYIERPARAWLLSKAAGSGNKK
jgi:peptidoglycan/LPS O-acetylase OafA/YrhL